MNRIPDLDANIIALVAAINQLPGLKTLSSCVGHSNPRGSQVPAGTFTVSIGLGNKREAPRGLTMLSWAIGEYAKSLDEMDCVSLKAWFNGNYRDLVDDADLLCFELAGRKPAIPDGLAEVIASALRRLRLN